jgi:hypothetical protein
LEQLTQLDLSLEQLPGLHGLDVLCPQLTSVAVNMNVLRSLEGLQGCSRLVHLSAQVRRHPLPIWICLRTNQLCYHVVRTGCTMQQRMHPSMQVGEAVP